MMRRLLFLSLLCPSLAWAGPHTVTLSPEEETIMAELAKTKGQSVDVTLQQLVSGSIAAQIQVAQMQTLARLQQRAWAGDVTARAALEAALKVGLTAPPDSIGPTGATPSK